MATIDMQTMRYINLLDKASKVKTMRCFVYNNTIFFAVPQNLISKAIGPQAINIKKMQDQIGKKIKIIREPNGVNEIGSFISDIVSPIKFKNLEVKDSEVIITAGTNQNKASLIGRNKRRLEELEKIIQGVFNFELKIL